MIKTPAESEHHIGEGRCFKWLWTQQSCLKILNKSKWMNKSARIHCPLCDGCLPKRIFEDHPMGDLQRLPVLIRDEAGLNQEAVNQSEHDTKHGHAQHTCGGQTNEHIWAAAVNICFISLCDESQSPTDVQGPLLLPGVQLGFTSPQLHVLHFAPKLQTWAQILHLHINLLRA